MSVAVYKGDYDTYTPRKFFFGEVYAPAVQF